VVGYGPFSLCVIHKEGLCLSSGGINRLINVPTAGAMSLPNDDDDEIETKLGLD
jgi:hypothetical protein